MGGSSGDHVAAGTASEFSTLQNLIKPFVGAGILALPNAFKLGGVLASAVLMAILAVGVNFCIRCLLLCVDYEYARVYGLDYDKPSGKFTVPADVEGNGNGVSSRSSPQEDDQRSLLTNVAASDEIDVSNSSAIALQSRSSPRSKNPIPADSLPMTPAEAAANPPIYSFREIGDFAFGKWGKLAVDVNLVASQIGFCIAYMSFISQNMIKVVDGLSRIEWILVLLAVWSILSQIRDIKKIAFTSGFGNFVYLVSLGIIFYDGFKSHCCVSAKDADYFRIEGIALVFGTGCFALEGIGLVLPVKRAMKDQDRFGVVLNYAITFVAGCYITFGVLGYLFYGENVHSVITDNLGSGPVSDSVRVSLSVSLIFTYIIQLYPVSEIADELWDSHVFRKNASRANAAPIESESLYSNSSSADKYQALNNDAAVHPVSHDSNSPASVEPPPTTFTRELALISTRIALVAFTAVVSIVFKNFGLIVSLVGSFSNSAIAFILPQLFYIKLVLKPDFERQKIKRQQDDTNLYDNRSTWWEDNKPFLLPYIIIVLGVAASVIGVVTTIQDIVTGDDS